MRDNLISHSLGRTAHQDAVLGPGNHIGYLNAFGKTATSLSDLEQISMDRMAYKSSEHILAASQFMADEIVVEFFKVKPAKVRMFYIRLSMKQNLSQPV